MTNGEHEARIENNEDQLDRIEGKLDKFLPLVHQNKTNIHWMRYVSLSSIVIALAALGININPFF